MICIIIGRCRHFLNCCVFCDRFESFCIFLNCCGSLCFVVVCCGVFFVLVSALIWFERCLEVSEGNMNYRKICSIKFSLDTWCKLNEDTTFNRPGHFLNALCSHIWFTSSFRWVLNELESVNLFFYYYNFEEDFVHSFTDIMPDTETILRYDLTQK